MSIITRINDGVQVPVAFTHTPIQSVVGAHPYIYNPSINPPNGRARCDAVYIQGHRIANDNTTQGGMVYCGDTLLFGYEEGYTMELLDSVYVGDNMGVINTLAAPRENTVIEIVFRPITSLTTSAGVILASKYGTASWSNGFNLQIKNSNNTSNGIAMIGYCNGNTVCWVNTTYTNSYNTLNGNLQYNARLKLDVTSKTIGYLPQDSQLWMTTSCQSPTSTVVSKNNELCLFGQNNAYDNAAHTYTSGQKIRLYSLKIYNAGDTNRGISISGLVRDFVPVRVLRDGVYDGVHDSHNFEGTIGLYDNVSGYVFIPQGNGTIGSLLTD